VQSKGAVLVLVWSFLAYMCSSIVGMLIKSVVPFMFEGLVGGVTAALYFLAGWLADVYFGRYKVIRAVTGLLAVDLARKCFGHSVTSDSSLPSSEH